MSRRLIRLNEQLKREISGIVRTAVRDPRVGRPAITDVRVAADLSIARVYVRPDPSFAAESGLGVGSSEGSTDELLSGLAAAAPFVRRELGKILEVRRVPELRFEIDRTFEDALRIERILGEVRAERRAAGLDGPEGATEGPAGGDALTAGDDGSP